MSAQELGLGLSVFLACAVEAVEALTIVLAVGTTRSWSAALGGVAAATAALAALVAALGPALTSLPIDVLRVAIGGLLLMFGLQWLRKAILRAAGLTALHDELGAYAQQAAAARAAGTRAGGFDGYSFTVAFQGVLLEGLEVAFIVLTFGSNQRHVGLAAGAAALAIVLVALVGAAARAPLAKVPENAMKFAVGVMLSSFGMFWASEGAGAHWPGGDLALLVIIPTLGLTALALSASGAAARLARRSGTAQRTPAHPAGASRGEPRSTPNRIAARASAIASSAWRFLVGDDWQSAVSVALAVALTALIAAAGVAAWWTMPAAILATLAFSIRRAAT